MAIRVKCGGCQSAFAAKLEWAGKTARCPKCKQTLTIPSTRSHVGELPSSDVASADPAVSPSVASSATPSSRLEARLSEVTRSSRPQDPFLGGAASPEVDSQRVAAPPSDSVATARSTTRVKSPQQPTRKQRFQQVIGAITGEIEPVRISLGYRLAAAAVTGVMLLLPVVYLCVILAAIWAMGYHATHHAAILRVGRPRGMLIMLVVYLAPIVIGVTVIIFMFKPFFAHERQTGRTRSITRHSEPILFALVEKICELVGAPMPKRIDVDCEANASASLRRGMLSLFESDDLVLTIGMPLVMSLNTRQFVGVLAHEFGHFAQSSGMRLSYVVRLVSAWLASAVYRRDSWDEWLAAQADDESWLAWLFVCAQGGVWLTRRILWCLMMLGSLSASLLLQRMEFDADQYEAKVAGSDAFESTMRHMVELGAAYGDAVGALYHYFCEGRLADNLPMLVEYHRSRMQPEHREQLQKSVDESQSSWFRTHPAPSARISQALAAEAEGIFQLEIPASALFTDPASLCRNVTWDFYRARLGSKVMPSDLKPMTAELAAQT